MTTSATPTAVATTTVTIQNMAFSPSVITVKQGSTVTWTNQDTVAHTVTADATGQPNSPASPSIAPGGTYNHTFTSTGTFHYHCKIHPDMTATVIVTP